jgi:uncharacterized protein YfaS (alpha-2-macroglobulin family)
MAAALCAAAPVPEVVSLKAASPQGEVAVVRQLRATFSAPMVKFGDPRLPAPLEVACTPAAAQKGSGRWVDDKTWVFDFAQDVPAGSRCSAAPRAGVKSLAGAALAGDMRVAFNTGGPAIVRAYPQPGEGSRVEEEQIFALLLNGAATTASIEQHAYCEFAGLGDRVPVRVVTGQTRDAILQAVHLVAQQARAVTLQCARPVPADSKLSLLWGPGIATASGVATTATRRLDYLVRPSFTASFTCERENARADCLPVRPLRLEFSSPVPRRWAEQIRLVAPDGVHQPMIEQHRGETVEQLVAVGPAESAGVTGGSVLRRFLYFFGRNPGVVTAPDSAASSASAGASAGAGGSATAGAGARAPSSEEGVSAVEFAAPLPESAEVRIELPPGLVDDAGRRLSNAALFPLVTRTAEAPALAKFPAATFGILELNADPVLPLTVRRVEGNLALRTVTLAGAPVRDLTLDGDAAIIDWMARLRRYDTPRLPRTQVEAELHVKLPPPPVPAPAARPTQRYGQTYGTNDAAGDDGAQPAAEDAQTVQTRTVSLLNGAAGVKQLTLPKTFQTDPQPFQVVGIPLPQPGFHVVEVASPRLGAALLGRHAPMYVRTSALVTNLAVHFKWGSVNSGAWVTTLDHAKPVADALVKVSDCLGRPVWQGRTDASGFALIAQNLPALNWTTCERGDDGNSGRETGYFVSARKTDAAGRADMAFVWSSWQDGIEPWRFHLSQRGGHRDAPQDLFHTVMDRTLLRAGQTLSMKHIARRQLLTGLGRVDAADLPSQLRIVHEGSGQHFDFPVTWQAGRSALNTFAIPEAAKLGVYDVMLDLPASGSSGMRRSFQTGSFRVEEFRLPVMSGRIKAPDVSQVQPSAIKFDVMVTYANGGGAAGLPLQVSAQWRDVELSQVLPLDRYPGFHFGPPQPPRDRDGADEATSPFQESYVDESDESDDSESVVTRVQHTRLVADKLPLTLDKAGAGSVMLGKLPAVQAPREMLVQATYADPNGQLQTLSQTLPVWPSALVLGVHTDDWVSVGRQIRTQVLALDTQGRPQAGVALSLHAVVHDTQSTRKRLVGGFYTYDNRQVDRDLGTVCQGTSDRRGLLLCPVTLAASGEVELVARANDAGGHAAAAAASVWVNRQSEVWFGGSDDDRMDLLPEQRSYEPGQFARFQVRSPFRHATALLAVERDGILETRTVELDGRNPMVELPVQAAWAPNVFVSVLAVRGRVREVPWYSLFTWGWKSPVDWWHAWRDEGPEYRAPTAMVDLSKPAFRLGIAEIQVGRAGHTLKVEVLPDRASYPIRATSQVRLRVTLPDGRPAPAGTAVALAAVDQALLDLQPNDSWNLLDAMLVQRDYGVDTSTAQMQVIGKRHFGKKAAPAGGGGGTFPSRELFDTLLLWKPDVALDAHGEATVAVPLNDALTSFRIVAIADTLSDTQAALFGTGSALIRSTQDLQIVSGVPPLVREGDRYRAMFTLRNTTARPMQAHLTARVGAQALPAQQVRIAPGAAADLQWDVQVPFNQRLLDWSVAADAEAVAGAGSQAGGQGRPASAHDRMKFTQRVAEAVPVTVQQATLLQVAGSSTVPVALPADALKDAGGAVRGGIEVALQPRLGGGLEGVRDYFLHYPWDCLEQRVSTAIALHDAQRWQALASQWSIYLDADGLASYFPLASGDMHSGSDSLTAYLLAVSDEASRQSGDPKNAVAQGGVPNSVTAHGSEFKLPDDIRAAMQRGLINFVEGRLQRDFWHPAFLRNGDLDVRKLAALEALSRDGKVMPRMLDSIQILPNQWPTGAVIDWLQVLQRVPTLPQRAQRLAEAEQILRARLNLQGTRLGFSTERDDSWWWLMSNGDVNSVRLLLVLMAQPGWQADLPRLATGALQRQQFGHWSTTVANAWGTLAMAAFSQRFESTPVAGTTRASFQNDSRASFESSNQPTAALDWAQHPDGGLLALGWPAADATLRVTHQGAGKPWATVTSKAAVPLAAPWSSGYRITKTLKPVVTTMAVDPAKPVNPNSASSFRRGDIVRVRLDIDVQADATWVVVNDPIPAGATLLGSGLGGDDVIATGTERDDSRAWLAYQARSQEAFRAYYRYLPKGHFSVEYTLRLNNPGRFGLPPTRVEAMYAPEMFGALPNAAWVVGP